MSQMYRARAVITHRKAVEAPADVQANRNPNPEVHVQPNDKFDPAAAGLSKAELERMVRAGHVVAIGEHGDNLDQANTLIALASYAGPQAVPSTTERDAQSGGAAPDPHANRAKPGESPAPQGAASGNTSPMPNAGNTKPGQGGTVSGPGAQTDSGKIASK